MKDSPWNCDAEPTPRPVTEDTLEDEVDVVALADLNIGIIRKLMGKEGEPEIILQEALKAFGKAYGHSTGIRRFCCAVGATLATVGEAFPIRDKDGNLVEPHEVFAKDIADGFNCQDDDDD